ncbi:hypothetical protein J6590_012118 [Homalodisca vitripennis]|nr:hypothetical protein J6590_012118 [Homalodisca vitripennis]
MDISLTVKVGGRGTREMLERLVSLASHAADNVRGSVEQCRHCSSRQHRQYRGREAVVYRACEYSSAYVISVILCQVINSASPWRLMCVRPYQMCRGHWAAARRASQLRSSGTDI